MYCCEKCFCNEEIVEFIKENDEEGDCEYCGSEDVHVCDVGEVGAFIREGLGRAYEDINDGTGAIYDGEEGEYIVGESWDNEGNSVYDILTSEECVFPDYMYDDERAEGLCNDLISESTYEGDWLYDGTTPNLVLRNGLYGVEATDAHCAWSSFKFTCKYVNRFFDLSGQEFDRRRLLSSLKDIFTQMVDVIPKDTVLYRARKYSLKNKKHTLEEISNEIAPAPVLFASNNRMSPAGISYTYLGDTIQTCLNEIRGQLLDNIIIGEYITKVDLKIVDLSKMFQVKVKSIFSENYNHDMLWMEQFIKDFTQEISKPITENEKDLEYVATQLLAEYIRSLGYEGIKFESSLQKNTYNTVLFCGPKKEQNTRNFHEFHEYFGKGIIEYDQWLELIEVKEITVQKSYQDYSTLNNYQYMRNINNGIEKREDDIKSIFDLIDISDIVKD